jgi:hypothetical protein
MSEHDPLAEPTRAPDGLVPPVIDHEPEGPPVARPIASPRARSGGTPLWFTLLLGLGLAGGVYYVWANPRGPDPDAAGALSAQIRTALQNTTALSAQMQTAGQQIQALSDRVDKLEKAPPPPAAAPADPGDLPKRLDDLAAKVAALENQPAAAAVPSGDGGASQQAVAALSQKLDQVAAADKAALDQLQTQQKDALDQAAAAAQAQENSVLAAIDGRVSKLEQGAGSVEDAASRATRLERIQAAVVALQAGQKLGEIPGAPPALSMFANRAPPTEAALRDSFPSLAAHASAVSQPDTAHKTFLQRAFARLQQSVTVREGNEVLVGDPAAGLLSDAGIKVQNGDLPGAVAKLQGLHGPAMAAMQGWIDQAQSLIAARAALASLAARG